MIMQQMSVVEAVERVVERHPARVAIRTADRLITYQDLGERVYDLTTQIEKHTSLGEFLGIEAGRNPHAIVSMIAALRSDRPFVVLDPRDSTASNQAKVASLGVNLVCRASPDADAVELIATPEHWRYDTNPLQPPAEVAQEDGIAYAIHTSGSTGQPKCVLVRKRPLNSVIQDHVQYLELGPQCRTLQFARLTFDGCLTEILWTLSSGACLVVLDETMLAPGTVLSSTLEDFQITHLKTTPFALTATDPTSAMSLRHVINGGGACRPAVVQKWARIADFHNAYGTTETTICNFLSPPLAPEACAGSVPLGDVVGDCEYDLVPAPADGVTSPSRSITRGELMITGDSVALGYLTDRGIQRFTDEAGNGIYKTGDVVEIRDGQLFFVERVDRQLKVRGYRLDPGEVESVACRLSSVLDAVVTAESHADGGEADALVCYYQGDADPRAMRGHLESFLDSYKVPSVVERIETLPYTANGKVDRDALIAARRGAASGNGSAAPETRLIELVRWLTGVGDAGLDDNFFELGGDSASAVVLVSKLKELGWTDAGVRDVLRAENLKMLADGLWKRSV